jgi:hypothetical protein
MLSLPLAALTLGSLALSSALPPLGSERKLLHDLLGKRGYNTSSSCLTDAAPVTSAPKPNIWAQIPPEDNLAVWNLLHAPASGLNLTLPSKAKPSDNYVQVSRSTLHQPFSHKLVFGSILFRLIKLTFYPSLMAPERYQQNTLVLSSSRAERRSQILRST